MAVESSKLQLPLAVISHSDVGRLIRELETVDNVIRSASVQHIENTELPKSSRLFEELIMLNKLDMHKEEDRREVGLLLEVVRNKAPVLHMSFNTDPSPIFTERLMTWLRQHIHPFVLLQIGLSPNIGAGCLLRTTNKYFDFTLRQRFTNARPMLITKLRGGAVVAPTGDVTIPAEVIAR